MSAHRSSLFASHQRGRTNGALQPPRGAGGDVEAELQRENDAMIEGVSLDMSRLKAAAQTLRDETADHNKLLDTLQSGIGLARDGVKSTIGKIDGVMSRYGCRDTFSCAGVVLLFLVIAYFALRWYLSHAAAAANATTAEPSAS